MFWRASIWMNSAVLCTLMTASVGCSNPHGPAQNGRLSAASGLVAAPQSTAAVSPEGTVSPANTAAPESLAARTAMAPRTTAIPGTDPAIQRWYLDNGGAKIAFNNALLRAERGVAATKSAECRPLAAGTRVLLNVLPKLKGLSVAGQKLAAAIEIPISTFSVAASQCVAGDFSTAKATFDLGVSQQADAQSTTDEILDGDK